MSLGVAYLMTNPDYAARVVVSIDSLRNWYDGPILLVTTQPSAHALAHILERDSRLRIQCVAVTVESERRNSAYVAKTALLTHSPFDVTVFLDADTLVVGDPNEFFESAKQNMLSVTCFADWQTTDGHRTTLLRKWRNIEGTPEFRERIGQLVAVATTTTLPSINTGVFAISKNAAILPEWQALAAAGQELPIPDELALQLLLPECEYQLYGSEYNASPIAPPEDVKIWHFLAQMHLAEPKARRIWLPAYQDCRQRNVASITEWSRINEVDAPSPS